MIGNVDFLEGDWTTPVSNRSFRVIVSNPPYVARDDGALGPLRAEPALALMAGARGLDAIEILARDCRAIIEGDGLLLLEHGAEQRRDVAKILKSYGWHRIQCYDDFAGHPRVTGALYPTSEKT